jgi:hypothetical protein
MDYGICDLDFTREGRRCRGPTSARYFRCASAKAKSSSTRSASTRGTRRSGEARTHQRSPPAARASRAWAPPSTFVRIAPDIIASRVARKLYRSPQAILRQQDAADSLRCLAGNKTSCSAASSRPAPDMTDSPRFRSRMGAQRNCEHFSKKPNLVYNVRMWPAPAARSCALA